MVMSEGIWDLIWVSINGENVQARPIEWDGKPVDAVGNDEYGNPVKPIVYMTTCPKCSQLVRFHISDIGDNRNVVCPTCAGIPMPYYDYDDDDDDVQKEPNEVHEPTPINPFIDPITAKIINTDNYIL